MKSHANVTIIVPVYGDWSSLKDCINALKQYVDDKHTILFVNDRGPEHDVIEKNIKREIKGLKNYIYHANKTNLGFLKNCNNAVLNIDKTDNDVLLLNSDTKVTEGFLDELIEVAYLSDRHGTVCPRSSDATIASIPLYPRDPEEVIKPDFAYSIYENIKDALPRYSISPVSVGFCFYVKRTLIHEMGGLFDEVFGMGYGEEDDFCMRINKHGYVSVIANHAFVFHMSARSFTPERRSEILATNAKILEERHPNFNILVHHYLAYKTNFYEAFGETLYLERSKKTSRPNKVLIDLHSLPTSDSNNIDEIREILKRLRNDKRNEYTVATSKATMEYLDIPNSVRFSEPHELNEQFDIGIMLFTVRDINDAAFLQRTCSRLIMATDVLAFIRENNNSAFADQVKIAERMIQWSDVILYRDDEQRHEYELYATNHDMDIVTARYEDIFKSSSRLIESKVDRQKRWEEINTIKAIFAKQPEQPSPPIAINQPVVKRILRRLKVPLPRSYSS